MTATRFDGQIRRADPTDGPALRALQSELGSPWPDLLALAFREPGPTCLVAVRDGRDGRDDRDDRIVGYVLALDGADPGDESPEPGYACQVVELVVAPSARRGGVGAALLDAVADRTSASLLWLTVRSADDDARSFYESQGFAPTERLPDYYEIDGEPQDGIVLERPH